MLNKQNIHIHKHNSTFLLTHQLKPKNRYPLNCIESVESKTNVAAQSTSVEHIKTSRNLSESKLFKYDEKDLQLSLKQKYKLKHISLVHELIANARSKKSEIEDLLRKEQNDAQLEELDEHQIASSLRKLKKVVRLMEIVCKIIIGKNESNNMIDLSTQQSISFKEMHQQLIANYQHQLNIKNCEIKRLKKLVEILSAPQESQENNNSSSSNNSLNNSLSIESCFIVRNSNTSLELHQNKNDALTQTEQQQIINVNKKHQQNQQKSNSNSKKKLNNFIIHESYSLWNILDAKQLYGQSQQKKEGIHQVEQSTMVSLLAEDPTSFQLQVKNSFLKRYKSIVKISINSLTLCNNIFLKNHQNQTTIKISKQIDDISNYFNMYYHNEMGKYNEHCDNFCKDIKEKLSTIYENVHKIYKMYIHDKEALSFWNDQRINF